MAHRGPDDQGVESGDWWGLVSRRLAIIGVETGRQPLSNEDGTIWVAFNGEIYNHWRLRDELCEQGHVFSSRTDTEVLVHLYEEHGDELVGFLEGMFAFALVDTVRERLLLGRDRLGQKPLYYSLLSGGELVFASECRTVLCHGGVSRGLDVQSLGDYLSLGVVPSPRSMFAGIRKVPPACTLSFERDGSDGRLVRYWRPEFEPKLDVGFRDAAVELREHLERAVSQRLESEVPLGAFLSGGIDSTAIVGLMAQFMDTPVHTFTVGFDDSRYDERRYASLAASAFGTHHRTRVADARDAGLLRRLLRHYGEPFADSSMLPTALLSEFAREHVTVALSGDGGDEVFGGYRRYQAMLLYQRLSLAPRSLRQALLGTLLALLPRARSRKSGLMELRRTLQALLLPPVPAYGSFQCIFSPDARAALMAQKDEQIAPYTDAWEGWMRDAASSDFAEGFMELDLMTYLPDDLLCKVDVASMMHSLEVRSPFMDHRLVEFAAALPRHYKVTHRHRKRILLAAVADLLPPAIRSRGKQGFGVPVGSWLRQELADEVREMVFWQREWDPDGFFDADELRRLAEEHMSGVADHSFRLWALICLRVWTEEILRPTAR